MATDTKSRISLAEMPTLDEAVPCQAVVLGEPCQNEAEWLLMMNCGHRSGSLCSPCRGMWIASLKWSMWECVECGFRIMSADNVHWVRL